MIGLVNGEDVNSHSCCQLGLVISHHCQPFMLVFTINRFHPPTGSSKGSPGVSFRPGRAEARPRRGKGAPAKPWRVMKMGRLRIGSSWLPMKQGKVINVAWWWGMCSLMLTDEEDEESYHVDPWPIYWYQLWRWGIGCLMVNDEWWWWRNELDEWWLWWRWW